MADNIPKAIAAEDPEDDDLSQKRKGKSIDFLISKVKSKTGKKKSNAALLPSPKKKSNKTATAEATDPTSATNDNIKKTKKKKPKAKVKKDKPKKTSKSSDEPEEDVLGEDEYELADDSSMSEGEMSIPFVIEVIADGEEDVDQARVADVEKESKKHESMHNSHNALRALERADSGKSLKEMAGKSRRMAGDGPRRTRSINAKQALERVNSSKPLSEMQREIKTRERPRGVGRKRPSITNNPHRHSSLKTKGNTSGHGRPQRTKSLNAANAHAMEGIDLHGGGGEAQRKADRRHRRNNTSGLDEIFDGNNGSSRRTQRSIDEDVIGGSRRTHRSADEDLAESSRRTQRSIDEDFATGSSRRTQRSIDRSIDQDSSTRRTQRSIDTADWDEDDNIMSGELGLTNDNAESKKRAERRARRESQRNTVNQAAEVLQRADSGKSLKEIANDSRRRRSISVGSHKGAVPKRNNSAGPRSRRASVTAPEGGGGGSAAADSLRMKEIEAQIKAEEEALKEGH